MLIRSMPQEQMYQCITQQPLVQQMARPYHQTILMYTHTIYLTRMLIHMTMTNAGVMMRAIDQVLTM